MHNKDGKTEKTFRGCGRRARNAQLAHIYADLLREGKLAEAELFRDNIIRPMLSLDVPPAVTVAETVLIGITTLANALAVNKQKHAETKAPQAPQAPPHDPDVINLLQQRLHLLSTTLNEAINLLKMIDDGAITPEQLVERLRAVISAALQQVEHEEDVPTLDADGNPLPPNTREVYSRVMAEVEIADAANHDDTGTGGHASPLRPVE